MSLSEDYNTVHKLAKPPFPYLLGEELCVVSHDPPPPPHGRMGLKYKAAREREQVDILMRCLRHPPLAGRVMPQERLQLKIVETIRAEDGHPAQIVTVQVLSGGGPELQECELVAKFYDPLYYNHRQDDVDPFLCVDRHYTQETAAYRHLSRLHFPSVPRFYGSYSLEIPVNTQQSRHVRLILMEKIDGAPMNHLNPGDFTLQQRQHLMKQIVDIDTALYQVDVFHRDTHPRNFIVRDLHTDHPEIVFINFGSATVGHCPKPEEESQYLPGTYISPLLRWPEDWWLKEAFKDSVTWDWGVWIRKLYRDDEAGITDSMRKEWSLDIDVPDWSYDMS